MINILYLFILLLFFIILLPLFVTFLVIYFGFSFLEFSTGIVLLLLLLISVASFINIPLSRKRLVSVTEPVFFGMFHRVVWKNQGVSINLGGAIIPLLIVGYFISQIPLDSLLITTSVVAFFSFIGARFIQKKGVVISMMLPVLFSAFFSLMLAPEYAVELAFSAGVLGVLIGADLLRIPFILRKEGGVVSIGGAGIFDAIFLVGLASAILAGF